jgi:hypothetical protein
MPRIHSVRIAALLEAGTLGRAQMDDLSRISWIEEGDQIVRERMFGDRAIFRLTEREKMLVETYSSFLTEKILPAFGDNLGAEILRARDRSAERYRQDQKIEVWLDKHAFTSPDGLTLDRADFDAALGSLPPTEFDNSPRGLSGRKVQRNTATLKTSSSLGRGSDWSEDEKDAFIRQIVSIAHTVDGLPPIQADLLKEMADWCQAEWGEERVPSDTTLKGWLRRWVPPLR